MVGWDGMWWAGQGIGLSGRKFESVFLPYTIPPRPTNLRLTSAASYTGASVAPDSAVAAYASGKRANPVGVSIR